MPNKHGDRTERSSRTRRAAASLVRTSRGAPSTRWQPASPPAPRTGPSGRPHLLGTGKRRSAGPRAREVGSGGVPCSGGHHPAPWSPENPGGREGVRERHAPLLGGQAPTSLAASPSVALAVAVIHTVEDDEGKGEEAKLHLGGRAGERRLSESGNWGAHQRTGAGALPAAGEAQRESRQEPEGSAGQLPAAGISRLDPERPGEKRAGWGVGVGGWRAPGRRPPPRARPNLRRGGRGERTHGQARAAQRRDPERTAASGPERGATAISKLATSAAPRLPPGERACAALQGKAGAPRARRARG